MYNLHCHTILSDGMLLPSEVAVRFLSAGYKAIAITDHVDYSNIESVITAVLKFTRHWPADSKLKVLPGIELTHLPPGQFGPLAKYARNKGIKVIIGHGQTPVEPVAEGTNRAALEADIDILAHPGLITDADAGIAKKKGVFLEVTTRKGHSQANRHIVECALRVGAKLILDIDSHTPEDIIGPVELAKAGLNAGLRDKELDKIYQDVGKFIREGR